MCYVTELKAITQGLVAIKVGLDGVTLFCSTFLQHYFVSVSSYPILIIMTISLYQLEIFFPFVNNFLAHGCID